MLFLIIKKSPPVYLLNYIKIKGVAKCIALLQSFGLIADRGDNFIPWYLWEALFIKPNSKLLKSRENDFVFIELKVT